MVRVYLGRDIPMNLSFLNSSTTTTFNPNVNYYLTMYVNKHVPWYEWCARYDENSAVRYERTNSGEEHHVGYLVAFKQFQKTFSTYWIEDYVKGDVCVRYDFFVEISTEQLAVLFKLMFGEWKITIVPRFDVTKI
jgi:hypothetical protein